jgi:hypothetical protein
MRLKFLVFSLLFSSVLLAQDSNVPTSDELNTVVDGAMLTQEPVNPPPAKKVKKIKKVKKVKIKKVRKTNEKKKSSL